MEDSCDSDINKGSDGGQLRQQAVAIAISIRAAMEGSCDSDINEGSDRVVATAT